MNFDLSTLDRLVTEKKSSESKSTKFVPRAGVRAVRWARGAGLGRETGMPWTCHAVPLEVNFPHHHTVKFSLTASQARWGLEGRWD